jgi:hypothetical protein
MVRDRKGVVVKWERSGAGNIERNKYRGVDQGYGFLNWNVFEKSLVMDKRPKILSNCPVVHSCSVTVASNQLEKFSLVVTIALHYVIH